MQKKKKKVQRYKWQTYVTDWRGSQIKDKNDPDILKRFRMNLPKVHHFEMRVKGTQEPANSRKTFTTT